MGTPLVIWTIAGFDPSSGAGITADLKTITAYGCYGTACITALTVQNTMGVRRVQPISPLIVNETLHALLDDFHPNAIKIGMLGTAEIANSLASFLEALALPSCPVVLDPVLCSSSGASLLDAAGTQVLIQRLLPLVTVITPNRNEAAILTGLSPYRPEEMARALRTMGADAAVVTGGDPLSNSDSEFAEDSLAYLAGGSEFVETLSSPRLLSTSTHGTGCAFSTAIACSLALGRTVPMAVTSAKAFVHRAIQQAPGLGRGKGPLALEYSVSEERPAN